MTKPTILSILRLLGALVGYTALSFACLFMGNYSKGIFIDIALGLLMIVLTYGLFNLAMSKGFRAGLHKELKWLSLIFLLAGLFMMYEVGFGYKINDAVLLTRALICAVLFFITAVVMLLVGRKPGQWGCILILILITVIFVRIFKTYQNIVVNTMFLIPFYMVLDTWKDSRKKASNK